jgi:Middle or third domain of peptidase_M16
MIRPEINPEMTQQLLDLLTPENCRITVALPNFFDGKEETSYKTARYYGTQYSIQPFSEQLKEVYNIRFDILHGIYSSRS